MIPSTVSTIYKYSILGLVFVIASPFYGATLGVLVLVFFCWLYFRDYKNLVSALFQPHIAIPVLLYLIVFIGAFFADDRREALSSLSTKLPFLLFPVIVGTSSIVSPQLIRRAANLFIIAISLSLLIALAYALVDVYVTGEKLIQIDESFYKKWKWYGLTRIFPNWHPTYVAICANLAIAIQFQNVLNVRDRNKKKTLLITTWMFAFLSVCIVLVNSMIGVACYFCILLYTGLLFLKHFKVKGIYRLSLLCTLGIGAFAFFYFNPLNIQKLNDLKYQEVKITDTQGERNLLTMRMAKWKAYTDIIENNLVLGVTEGDIKDVRDSVYITEGYQDLHRYNYNAHNQYLEVFAMYGLIGFLLFLYMLASPFFPKSWHPLLPPFIIITGLSFLTESILQRQQGILLFMALYALLTNPKAVEENQAG